MRRNFQFSILSFQFICLCFLFGCTQKEKTMEKELTMVVGTYTDGDSEGIYTFRFNQETGETVALSKAEVSNPSYLTISDDNKYVYAVSEHGDGREAVNAFKFDKSAGTLHFINKQPAMGADPCYISTNGKNIVTANYSGGSISVFPIGKDGEVLAASDVINFSGSGPDTLRQKSSHLHCVEFSPDGKYLFANDLGADNIYKMDVNAKADAENKQRFLSLGTPHAFKVSGRSGPRHITFTPNGQYAYLINEIGGTVTGFQYSDGMLKEIETVVADDVHAEGSGDIHVSPDGRFVYATNRLQADGLAIFQINQTDGKLTRVGYQLTGIHPRNFIITPNGKYLLVACRDNNAIQVFERNQETGLVTNTQKDIKVDKPVCIKFAN
nr:lactonase family protein [Bacteroides sp. 519]